jgi:hypothetical protein
MMETFVNKNSIVREIWGKADTVLFIFAGAAAEFALNKAVDWLYFTGRLPADPLGRLFSTVTYARQIIFLDEEAALSAIDKITAIHKGVEKSRGAQIPGWAYLDVLYMLIDYSIQSFELLERKLSDHEKNEVFEVFHRVGKRMQLADLPGNYPEWIISRDKHMDEDLLCSDFTMDLYLQYKKHLGAVRYLILKQVQLRLVPGKIKSLLPIKKLSWISPVLMFYKFLRFMKISSVMKSALLPKAYREQIKGLDIIR